MTFLEICKKVRQECGIQGSNQPVTVVSQSGILKRVVDWVVDADLVIQTMHPDWNFLWKEHNADTQTGVATVAVPDDLGMWNRKTFGVNRGTANGRRLTVVDHDHWRDNYSLKSNSEPSSICILPDNSLVLSAPADNTYTISAEYWAKPTPLTTNDQVPVYPFRFHRAIIARAKMFFFEDVEAVQLYQLAEKEFISWVNELESFAMPTQQPASQSNPRAIVVRPV